MLVVNAIIAVGLLVFALLARDEPGNAAMFIGGAVLAAIAFKHWLSTWMVRVLALVSAAAMFSYFAQFFVLVPTLQPGWYWQPHEAVGAVGLLFAGFAMIPVLSEYSCRMKASEECERGRRQAHDRNPVLASLRASQTSRPLP